MANAARHKDALVFSAATLFREKGYAATGLNEILKESGAPKGSLYYYFPAGKEELGAAAVTMAGKAASNTLQELRAKTSGARGFIEQYCKLLARWMEASDFRSGCPIATTVLETCPRSKLIQRAGKEVFEHWVAIVGAVFEAEGLSPTKARSAAVVLICAVEGSLILARAQSSVEPIVTISTRLGKLLVK